MALRCEVNGSDSHARCSVDKTCRAFYLASVPTWSIIVLAVSAGVPVGPIRFSLRTLLIATTLIAVVLGIIVWMSRAG